VQRQVRGLTGRSPPPAAQPRQGGRELGLVVADQRDQVAIVERLSPDQRGEPGRRHTDLVTRRFAIDHVDERADLGDDIGGELAGCQVRPAPTRPRLREAARAADDGAQQMPAAR